MSFNPTNPTHVARRAPEPMTQLRAATALVLLIQEDAPAAVWEISETGNALSGHIMMLSGTDNDRRQAMAAWQRVLGAGPVSASRVRDKDHLSVAGSYEGIPARVVTIVDAQSDLERKLASVVEGLGDDESLTADDLRSLLGGEAA